MNQANLLALNVTATLTRMAATVFLGLWTTRIVYQQLGEGGFGAYSAATSLAMFLMLAVEALASSTQRHTANAIGADDKRRVRTICGTSLVLSASAAATIVIAIAVAAPWLATLLNAPADQTPYLASAIAWAGLTLGMTIVRYPFKSYFVSHQSIVLVSIFDLAEALSRFLAAILILYIPNPSVADYACAVALCVAVPTLALLVIGLVFVPDTRPCFPVGVREMVGLAFWMLVGSFGWKARTQGVQLLINVLCGAAATASYSIALQLAMYQNNFTTAFNGSVRPAVNAAYGRGAMEQVKQLAEVTSKLLSFGMLPFLVTMLFETHAILVFWLGAAPTLTVIMVRLVATWMSVKDLTLGHHIALHARGNIARHEIVTTAFDLVALPIASALVVFWSQPPWVFPLIVIFSVVLQSVIRAWYFREAAGASFRGWISRVVTPYLLGLAAACAAAFVAQFAMAPSLLRVAVVAAAASIVSGAVVLRFGVTKQEWSRGSAMLGGVVRKVRSCLA